MKRMLINATQEEELRMAMVDGQRLYDLNIELPASERTKANIYKGKITRIEPSLEAAFVDYGADRHGFLPLKEISSEYFVKNVESGGKTNIKDVMKEGQDIVIQIDKEERGNKGAALTTFVSLAGRFIVLKPNKPRSGGVSRRIVGADRDVARDSLKDVDIPNGMSVILRTAGIDRNAEELSWDLDNLLKIWQAILNVVLEKPSPFLIYRESNSVVRSIRDYLTNEIGEILIDDEATFKEAHEFVSQVMPHNLRKLKHYSDPVPLFTRYQIETQIESAFSHLVTLPSGGSIVIDHTEALVSIDINSARATKGGDIEATALSTNSEAAEEIARQLRLRDLGGLIVIDFIDMGPQKNQRDVENRLRDAVRQDRARVQIGKISRFGLLEMSRQRLRPSLGESSYHTCPRCSGLGTIRSIESLALTILRIIGEEARKERTSKVIAQLPVEVATYLLNEKRDWVQSLEARNDTQVVLVANASLETPHYQIRRVRDDQLDLSENVGASYELMDLDEEPELPPALQDKKVAEPAAVATMKPTAPAPAPAKKPKTAGKGFWATLIGLFTSGDTKPAKRQSRPGKRRESTGKDSRGRNGQRSRRRNESKSAGDKRESRDSARKAPKKRTRKKAGDKQAKTGKIPTEQTQVVAAPATDDANEIGRAHV
jgi:ribonuclease E